MTLLRIQLSVYAVAFFAGNVFSIVTVIIPLWALELDASPLTIGLLVSSRQVLAVIFSIHAGALLDKFDSRRVIIFLSLAGSALAALYPLLPLIIAAIAIQMLAGFAEVGCWIGAQSLVGRLLEGKPVYAGRMTAVARAGGFIGPALAGFAWQIGGSAGGFGFLAVWILLGSAMALMLPSVPPHLTETDDRKATEPEKASTKFLPKSADYKATLRLLLLPAIALIIAATFMRQVGSGIQSSFYGVWLSEAGITASMIGLLIGTSSLVSAFSALSIGPLVKRFDEQWLLIVMIFLPVVAIAVTPALSLLSLLFIATALRGIGQGLNLPLMMSIASRSVGQDLQARIVALRISFNRFGSMIFPVLMGLIAEFSGLEAAFYIVGAAAVMLIGLLSLWVWRVRGMPANSGGHLEG